MGLLDRLFGSPVSEAARTVPLAEHAALRNDFELLSEAYGDGMAALRREDAGWSKVGGNDTDLLTRAELIEVHRVCLTAFVRAPLIGRAVRVRRNMVWGQGVEITARDASNDDGGDAPVNALIQGLLDSPEWQRAVGSGQAREERELNLHTAGEFFLLAVHDQQAKTVRPRLVLPAQIVDYIANPDDPSDVWLYRRQWTTKRTDLRFADSTGRVPAPQTVTRAEWHPTLAYARNTDLRNQVMLIGADPVRWDQPIQHCAVNSVGEAPWGYPDVYAALDWDRAYAEYLSGWAGLMKSLARYAFKATAPAKHGPKVTRALANGRGTDPITGQATDPVGQTAVMSPDATMAPMHSSGATIDSGSGKPLAGMVAAALDVPITILLADPGVTGARATAETLDKPQEDAAGSRRQAWTDWLKAFFDHVIATAIDDRLLPADADTTVDVTFPSLSDVPLDVRMKALTEALNADAPPQLILKLMLEALGVEDVDEILDGMVDERGNFVSPRAVADAAARQREQDGAPGSQAEEAYR